MGKKQQVALDAMKNLKKPISIPDLAEKLKGKKPDGGDYAVSELRSVFRRLGPTGRGYLDVSEIEREETTGEGDEKVTKTVKVQVAVLNEKGKAALKEATDPEAKAKAEQAKKDAKKAEKEAAKAAKEAEKKAAAEAKGEGEDAKEPAAAE